MHCDGAILVVGSFNCIFKHNANISFPYGSPNVYTHYQLKHEISHDVQGRH